MPCLQFSMETMMTEASVPASTSAAASDVPGIDDIIKRMSDLPALPAVAADLVSSMDDDELDLGELVAKIECDQALATKTVRVARCVRFFLVRIDSQSKTHLATNSSTLLPKSQIRLMIACASR